MKWFTQQHELVIDPFCGSGTTLEAAKRAGTLPAGLERMVGAALASSIPWEQIVHRFVSRNAHTESAWRKPNRRYLARGVVLPSLWQPDVPDFVLACDTSAKGSASSGCIDSARPESGLVRIAMSMTPQDLWEMFTKLGFGQQPKWGFPGAVAGALRRVGHDGRGTHSACPRTHGLHLAVAGARPGAQPADRASVAGGYQRDRPGPTTSS